METVIHLLYLSVDRSRVSVEQDIDEGILWDMSGGRVYAWNRVY